MTRALLAVLFLSGCTAADLVTPHPSFTPQQRAGMVALGGQMMAAPPPPAYSPTRCTTSYSPGGMGFPPSATTNCY